MTGAITEEVLEVIEPVKKVKKEKIPLAMKVDQLEYAIAIIGMLANDVGKNGLTQKEVAERIGIHPSTLSKMRNLRRYITGTDVENYCEAKGLTEEPRDFIRISAAIKKYPLRKAAMKVARKFMMTKGRKERFSLRRKLDNLLIPFLVYGTDRQEANEEVKT